LSISESSGRATEFDGWIVAEFATRGSFTALVVLVEIGDRSVTPLASTYLNVMGTEVDWLEIRSLFAGPGIAWDGASFFPATAPEGGPLDNKAARAMLRDIEARVKAELLTLNEGFFFDRNGRRMMVEEISVQ
jgi:hypothetical protein